MGERWLGVSVVSEKVVLVDAEIPDAGPLIIQADMTWALQEGKRPDAYRVMHQHVADYVRENHISRVVIKGSTVSLGGTTLAHLTAAELRGVVASAAAGVTFTEFRAMGAISRNFGERKVDEYLKDTKFWSLNTTGEKMRIGSRDAAMVLLAARATK